MNAQEAPLGDLGSSWQGTCGLPVKPGSHTPAQLSPALVEAQVGGKRPLLREAPGVPRHTAGEQTTKARQKTGTHVCTHQSQQT